jgi:hypothetical protein
MKKILCIFGTILLTFPLLQMVPASYELYKFENQEAETDLWTVFKAATVYSASLSSGGTGIIIMGFIVDGLEYRPKWLFKSMIILGIIWSLCYPYGVAIGGVLLVYAIGKRKKFQSGEKLTEKN